VAKAVSRRFVLLRHTGHGPLHFDLMIEDGAALATWQFDLSPTLLASGTAVACRRLAAHRIAYLDYAGPVSRGRGQVHRTAAGICTLHFATAADWDFELDSPTLNGRFRLQHLTGFAWSLTKLAAT